jgi:hypothetical protein
MTSDFMLRLRPEPQVEDGVHAARSTIETLLLALRERGEAALHESSCQRRLSEQSVAQAGGIIERLDRLRPRYPAMDR